MYSNQEYMPFGLLIWLNTKDLPPPPRAWSRDNSPETFRSAYVIDESLQWAFKIWLKMKSYNYRIDRDLPTLAKLPSRIHKVTAYTSDTWSKLKVATGYLLTAFCSWPLTASVAAWARLIKKNITNIPK